MNRLLFSALLIFVTSISYSQVRAVTEKGDKVILYDNFTWKPVIVETIPIAPKEIVLIGSVKAKEKTDRISGTKTLATEEWDGFGSDNMSHEINGYMQKDSDSYIVSLSFSGKIGCLNKEHSSIRIKLRNGMIIECIQISDEDCGEVPSASYILLNEEQLNSADAKEIMDEHVRLLASHDWESIRIYGSTFFADIKPRTSKNVKKPEQFFRQHISALKSND